ncbi:telomerase-binding protein EST1A-like [Heptranchias perlo]|uniref:telomerase-binding protein EST1A-like n=1 Tax=Heptranchias perlo TaxID=212740 RepID=UPI003559DB63
MRSLAASNPILTARESLMSLFEETKRKAEQAEFKRQQESDLSPGPRGKGRKQTFRQVGEDTSRVEVWIHASHPHSSQGSESGREDGASEQDEDLGNLSPSDDFHLSHACKRKEKQTSNKPNIKTKSQ